MDESFDLEKNLSDKKDGSKQATLDDLDKDMLVNRKKKKFICEEL